MKHLLMGVYQVCSNKSPWVKIGPARGRGEAYIQVSDLRAIMALLLKLGNYVYVRFIFFQLSCARVRNVSKL
jgi:hypothetical protein